jgi:hypothetical protein
MFNLTSLLVSFFAFFTISFLPLHAAYVDFGVGGDFEMSGYNNRDPRFMLEAEVGSTFLALPVSVSWGQNLMIVGVKPRLQVWISVPGLSNFSVAPGVAPIFNYWHADIGSVSLNVYEIGAQLSGRVRYEFLPGFHFTIVPVAIDMNFWRHATADTGSVSASASSTKFGMIYSTLLSLGVGF